MKKLVFNLFFLLYLPLSLFAQEIKIMSWNIFMVPPFIFKSCQTERAHLQAAFIKKNDPDIVVLNEAFMKSTRAILFEKLQHIFPYQTKITKKGFFKTNSGVWILSKYPISNQQFMKYKNKKGSDIFSKKGAVYMEVTLPHNKLQIIATHTQSLAKYRTAREKQFTQLKTRLADVHFTESIPQFIIGDLNCDFYDTSAYQSMLQKLDVLPFHFTGEKYSWNGKENELAYSFFDTIQESLDYILLRNAHKEKASVISTTIMNPKQDSCFCKNKYFNISDHHPIISTIQLK